MKRSNQSSEAKPEIESHDTERKPENRSGWNFELKSQISNCRIKVRSHIALKQFAKR